ncbi:VanZ family protein [Clostridium sp. BJN0013]|uniref:VanZ family protein n=1 Tax=Clostridium sp. BJN0013 TaxID=3236840 RepID=UPI0034C6A4E2
MKKIKWSLVIIWMVVIFIFSNETATISNEKSGFFIYLIQVLGLDLNASFGKLSNFVIRKVSHFLEYFILAILLFNIIKGKFKIKKVFIISIIIVFLYACSDEIHQIFIPGRTARIKDIFIDTAGGSVGLLVGYFINKKNSYRKEN